MSKRPTDKPLLLDLFCCAGGAARGYQRAGFYVVGVDIKHQPHYIGDEFYQADALEFLATHHQEFDAIHASPPCQAYSALKVMWNSREHPDLVAPVRELLKTTGKPYVIENVGGAPLDNPLMLCGSMFGLQASNGYQLRRHRFFESNVFLMRGVHCQHAEKTVGIYGAKARDIALEKRHYAKDPKTRGAPVGVVLPKEVGFEAMGIDWMSQDELSEAIPPAYTEYLGVQLMSVLGANVQPSNTACTRQGVRAGKKSLSSTDGNPAVSGIGKSTPCG